MRRLFAILLLVAAGLFAACTDANGSPGAPGVTTPPDAVPTDALPSDALPSDALPSDALPTDEMSPSPTVTP